MVNGIEWHSPQKSCPQTLRTLAFISLYFKRNPPIHGLDRIILSTENLTNIKTDRKDTNRMSNNKRPSQRGRHEAQIRQNPDVKVEDETDEVKLESDDEGNKAVVSEHSYEGMQLY